MQRHLFMLFLIIFSNCSHVYSQPAELIKYQSFIYKNFKGWINSFTSFKLSAFKRDGNQKFEDIDDVYPDNFKEFYSVYKPAISFSPDKSQFIDIYSYLMLLEKEGDKIVYHGNEADQAITLCNFKIKKWTRIAFHGTTERAQDVEWINNSKFIIVGGREQDDDYTKQQPVIYIGDVKTKTFSCYRISDKKVFQNKVYDSPKLLRLHIVEK